MKDEDGIVRRIEEEHTTLVNQPSGKYLGFAAPASGTGKFAAIISISLIALF